MEKRVLRTSSRTPPSTLKVGPPPIERTLSLQDIYLFAHVSGNTNPAHMPAMASRRRPTSSRPPCGRVAPVGGVRHASARPGTLSCRRDQLPRGVISATHLVSVRCAPCTPSARHLETKILKKTVPCGRSWPRSTFDQSMSLANVNCTHLIPTRRTIPAVDRRRPHLGRMATAWSSHDSNSLTGALLAPAKASSSRSSSA